MDSLISISWLNDFLFCPVSIYFHRLFGDADRTLFQAKAQISGTSAHKSIDSGKYTTKSTVLTALDVMSEQYGIVGKIDIFYQEEGLLVERKRHVSKVFPGYVMQMYAQCLSLREMGYTVRELRLRSLTDNKSYPVPLPEDSPENMNAFEDLLAAIRGFRVDEYSPANISKCNSCIYEPACDRSLSNVE